MHDGQPFEGGSARRAELQLSRRSDSASPAG